MSRIRKAAVAASFNYVQYALAVVSGLLLVPLTLHALGARAYGVWLATGELLGYAALADFGILAAIPWMLAEADGRRDRQAMRALVSNGVAVGIVAAAAYAVLAVILWSVLPSALSLTTADRDAVRPPLMLLVVATMVACPLRVFSAVLAGVQDVVFNGLLGSAQAVVSIALTVLLLSQGYGLYALAIASATASLLVVIASFVRVATIAPDLLSCWPRPSVAFVRLLLTNGIGVWLGAFGWRLASASNSLVIAWLGRPEWVAVYACTAKLGALATQLAWVVPDAGLIGLAQLHGERHASHRMHAVVSALLQLYLLLAGGAACLLLAFNPAFVTQWVGPGLFAGLPLNTLIASGIVVSSLTHGLFAAASVLGNRLRVGATTLVAGAIHVGFAVVLGRQWGLEGVGAAALVTGAAAVPAGIVLLRQTTALTLRAAWTSVVMPWLRRMVPLGMGAAIGGSLHSALGIWGTAAFSAGVAAAYVWFMRPFYAALPLDPSWGRWLVSLGLIPAAPQIAPARR